jgi:hypothetical protein
MAPLATIALDNGSQIELYEPSPGMLLVAELGTTGVPVARRPQARTRSVVGADRVVEAVVGRVGDVAAGGLVAAEHAVLMGCFLRDGASNGRTPVHLSCR